MSDDTHGRLVRLDLPLPLQSLVNKVLRAENADTAHERVLFAWETLAKMLAGTLWAACRELGLRSPEFDEQCGKLYRPSLGHWVGLVRTARGLLADRDDAAVGALAPLLMGLDRKYGELPGFAAMAARLKEVPGRKISPPGKTVMHLLQVLPAYRNATSAHAEGDTPFRGGSVAPMLNALLTLCEVAPPTGACRLIVALGRGSDGTLEALDQHGDEAPRARYALSETVAARAVAGRPYLVHAPDVLLAMFPVAAAEAAVDGWKLGWLQSRTHWVQLSS